MVGVPGGWCWSDLCWGMLGTAGGEPEGDIGDKIFLFWTGLQSTFGVNIGQALEVDWLKERE